ncbi:HAD-IA family hydrolase [Pseudomonas sp. zfem002]|uniref:HAD-IA family hydrolase n=1 Tax=Pseudomonas sp. zfem002 TaxID=3078197 RepID=UPI002928F2D0|nr:HAD-IA family hydrolase [Pseudomonas sp. zfem002]MDU9394692.1 HAD-IA family hydrolase [Pseudomonas sp. zfem002]
MSAIERVWFDFGGVLSPPIEALFAQYEVKTGLAPAALQRAFAEVAEELGVPPLAPIENALLSEDEWGRRVELALIRQEPSADLSRARLRRFGEQWFAGVQANAAMVAAARKLKASGFAIGILTNNVVEWEPYWRAIVGLDEVADLIVDSSREGCRKPDAQFFDIAQQRAGLPAEANLLIDDLAENVAAAAARGWRTVHFRDNRQALGDITHATGVCVFSAQQPEGALA